MRPVTTSQAASSTRALCTVPYPVSYLVSTLYCQGVRVAWMNLRPAGHIHSKTRWTGGLLLRGTDSCVTRWGNVGHVLCRQPKREPVNCCRCRESTDHSFGEKRTAVASAVAILTMGGEIVAGVSSGSMALLADGLHMASHTIAFGVALFAYRYARKHALNPQFTFGTGKVNALGASRGPQCWVSSHSGWRGRVPKGFSLRGRSITPKP